MELIIKPATDEETIEALKNTIERLQQQIKEMRCCQNCKHSTLDVCDDLVCGLDWDIECNDLDKWELAE